MAKAMSSRRFMPLGESTFIESRHKTHLMLALWVAIL